MIKCGIIGCGVIAPTHIKGFQLLKGVKVAQLCDLKIDKAKKLAAEFGVESVTMDYRKVLRNPEINLVSVCTDHASHAKIVCAALKAGKHVICEKALGHNLQNLKKMVAAAHRHPNLVSSGIFQHRFEPHNIALKKMIEEGDFGTMLNVNLNFSCLRTNDYYRSGTWRGTIDGEGGGTLINQAIHHIDQLRFLFGDVAFVTACTANKTHQGVIEVEDTAAFVVEFESGVFGTVAVTGSSPESWHIALTVNGSDIYLEYNDETATRVKASSAAKEEKIKKLLSGETNKVVEGSKHYYGGGHTDQLADVIDAINCHHKPKVTLIDAANTASIVFAVYKSAKTGRRVKVERFI